MFVNSETTDKRLNVIVCGSTYAQFYIEALRLEKEKFNIVGLLGQGSERSVKCANYYNIPIYSNIEELPEDIDLACVVVRAGILGGNGSEIALKFLEKGINVIQEQPIHKLEIMKCIKAAKKKNVNYLVGNMYAYYPIIKNLQYCINILNRNHKLLHIDMECSSQVTYPAIHSLLQLVDNFRPFEIRKIDSIEESSYCILVGQIGDVSLSFTIFNEINPKDVDNFLPVIQKISLWYDCGRLCMTDINGQLVWHEQIYLKHKDLLIGELNNRYVGELNKKVSVVIGDYSEYTLQDMYLKIWPRCIGEDLSHMYKIIVENVNNNVEEHLMILGAEYWKKLTDEIGYPVLREREGYIKQEEIRLLKDSVSEVTIDYYGNIEDIVSDISRMDVIEFCKSMKYYVGLVILYTFQMYRTCIPDEGYKFEEIIDAIQASSNNYKIIQRWLDYLIENKLVEKHVNKYYSNKLVNYDELKEVWKVIKKLWNNNLGNYLAMEYIEQNINNLPLLIQGKVKATFILFPEGSFKYADAIYRDTIMSCYLNKIIAQEIRNLACEKIEQGRCEKFRILELGAGTGATTDCIIKELIDNSKLENLEYIFSDISYFFINAAKERYDSSCPFMQYKIIDIQEVASGIDFSGSCDILVAAGVLNNAIDTTQTLKQIINLLKDGGFLFIKEPIIECPEILISQVFMMSDTEDIRKERNTTFLTEDEWTSYFKKFNLSRVMTYPQKGHVLEPLGEKLFILQK